MRTSRGVFVCITVLVVHSAAIKKAAHILTPSHAARSCGLARRVSIWLAPVMPSPCDKRGPRAGGEVGVTIKPTRNREKYEHVSQQLSNLLKVNAGNRLCAEIAHRTVRQLSYRELR